MPTKPKSVDDYIASFPAPAQQRLRELRKLSRANAPHAVEGLKWGNPAYSVDTILFVFSGHKQHANFVVTPTTLNAFMDEVAGYRTGKGSVQLSYDEPMPTDVLARMIAYRIQEWAQHGGRWM